MQMPNFGGLPDNRVLGRPRAPSRRSRVGPRTRGRFRSCLVASLMTAVAVGGLLGCRRDSGATQAGSPREDASGGANDQRAGGAKKSRGRKRAELELVKPEGVAALGGPLAADERVILFAGDIMPWNDRGGEMRTFSEADVHYPYRGTAPLVQQADYAVGDLEAPIAVNRGKRKKFIRFPYKMPPSVLAGVSQAGFDLVSLANNHVADYGTDAMLATIEHLTAAELPFIGLGADLASAERIHLADVGGHKVAFIACVSPETYLSNLKVASEPGAFPKRLKRMQDHVEARSDRPGSVLASVESVVRLVERANELADLVVVYPHWGIRYHRPPSSRQVAIAHAAIDAGADLIVGHHIHTWQPIETYGGAIIVYGLGNFAFDSRNSRAAESLVVRAIIARGRVDRVEIHPLATHNRHEAIRYQPKFLTGASARELLSELATASRSHDTQLEIVGNKAIARAPIARAPEIAPAVTSVRSSEVEP
ncbi:MAG: CapA family protein [Myxococcales bacterium FL481]|nr:MAG: CapA family protein [Myxococcales bacterium FL481]